MLTTASNFLTATEAGLVKWSTYKKPPYTTGEWQEACNNSVNLTAKVKELNDLGYSNITLEKGNYPICYGSSSTHSVFNGIENCVLDCGGAVFFVIFDSNYKNPYDTSSTPPHLASGAGFRIRNCTRFEMINFELVGDAYMRAWKSGESTTDNTTGIDINTNCYDIKIDGIIHGFRADSVSGTTRGNNFIINLTDWNKGGVDDTYGVDVAKVGSYRTGIIQLDLSKVSRSAVQIYTSGYLRQAHFRNQQLDVYFYRLDGSYITKAKGQQAEFIYLPEGCDKIQFVANDDERTTDTVTYGSPLWLVSGSSQKAEIRGRFFNNNRGGVANTPSDTLVDAHILDLHSTKYGNIPYASSTKYGVNNEDLWTSGLTVRGIIENTYHGVMVNGARADISATFKNVSGTAVLLYKTTNAVVHDCLMINVGNVYFASNDDIGYSIKKIHSITDNTINGGDLKVDLSNKNTPFAKIADNVFSKARISIKGNKENIYFTDNTILSTYLRYSEAFVVSGAYRVEGNTFNKQQTDSVGWDMVTIEDATISRNNDIFMYVSNSPLYLQSLVIPGIRTVSGINLKGGGNTISIYGISESNLPIGVTSGLTTFYEMVFDNCLLNVYPKTDGPVETYRFNKCEFTNGSFVKFSRAQGTTSNPVTIIFDSCKIDLTLLTKFLEVGIGLAIDALNIIFIECTFKSDVKKELPIVYASGYQNYITLEDVTSKATSCRYINVRNAKTYQLL